VTIRKWPALLLLRARTGRPWASFISSIAPSIIFPSVLIVWPTTILGWVGGAGGADSGLNCAAWAFWICCAMSVCGAFFVATFSFSFTFILKLGFGTWRVLTETAVVSGCGVSLTGWGGIETACLGGLAEDIEKRFVNLSKKFFSAFSRFDKAGSCGWLDS